MKFPKINSINCITDLYKLDKLMYPETHGGHPLVKRHIMAKITLFIMTLTAGKTLIGFILMQM